MIKVFIADKEEECIAEMKRVLNWEKLGCEICGEATDGEIAWLKIVKENPDIVIMEINLPLMDGLSLGRAIRKKNPGMEILYVTESQKFSDAKESVSLGVAGYLTKPCDYGELKQQIEMLVEKIEQQRLDEEMKNRYKEELKKMDEDDWVKFQNALFYGKSSVSEILEMAQQLETDISAMNYLVITGQIRPLDSEKNGVEESSKKIEKNICQWSKEEKALFFQKENSESILLLMGENQEEIHQKYHSFLDKIIYPLKGEQRIYYYMGIGSAVNRISEISQSYLMAEKAYAHRFFDSGSNVVDSLSLEKELSGKKEEFQIDKVNPKSVDRNKIIDFLRLGDRKDVPYFVEEFYNMVGKKAMKSVLFQQYMLINLYFCVSEFLEELGIERDEVESPTLNMENQTQVQQKAYVQRLISQVIEKREQQSNHRYADIASQAIVYVENNYADPELSLNQLALHMKFSPNHLSMVFSKQIGQPFTKYLTEYRMKKAKELLRCTSKKSNVVALEVGYKDPHYFSYLFKKTQGVTPLQYRNKTTE